MAIYATSNRRHLVRQTFADRAGDEVATFETIWEKTALAERFGLRIPYMTMSKSEYLALIDHLAGLYHVEMNREDNRLQVFFDGKPDADTRAELKSSGFRWAPSVGAWQRQLTDNAIRAADRLECIRPLSGEKPSQLQKKPSILQTMREQSEKVKAEPPKEAPAKNAER